MLNNLTKLTIIQLVALFLWTPFVNAYDKVHELTISQLETFQISQNKVTLNNFNLSEDDAFMAKGTCKVVVTFSVVNRNDVSKHFTAMFVGFENDSIAWSVDAEPGFASVSENKTEECRGSAYVPPGTLSKTTKIWLRVVGDF